MVAALMAQGMGGTILAAGQTMAVAVAVAMEEGPMVAEAVKVSQ